MARIQDRDLALVRWINGFGFTAIDPVSALWGVSYDVARARLATLVTVGILQSERSLLTGKKAFWPTPAGADLAGDELQPLRAIRWVTAGHDLAVQRLSIRLEKNAGRFEPERCIRRRRRLGSGIGVGVTGHVPDGLLHRDGETKPVAIEVEFTPKPKARLQKIVDGYRYTLDYSATWWYAGSETIRARLAGVLEDSPFFRLEVLSSEQTNS